MNATQRTVAHLGQGYATILLQAEQLADQLAEVTKERDQLKARVEGLERTAMREAA